jgi:nucleotide-binding universal stress UspA family protein
MILNRFVVPVDGSDFAEHAVGVAAGMAAHCGADLELLTTAWFGEATKPAAYLEELASRPYGVPVTTTLVPDQHPVDAIKAAAAAPGRVVCMTTHGRGRLLWALLGSVAENALRELDGPVLLVGRHCATEWPTGVRRMVVAVDGADAGPAVLPDAMAWAKTFGLEIDVATVIHPLDTKGPDKEIDAIVRRIEGNGLHARRAMVRGSYIAGAIADAAIGADADLIAMQTHGRDGLERVALGSVTMGVVTMAPCPVLVTRGLSRSDG